jgi:pectin methylesterase-like acyl-CoA thioesterase
MPNFTHRYVLALISLLFTIAVHAQQPAFPGAEGAGMLTTGGRGTAGSPTTVFEVTNLNDDNVKGSLRYALQSTAAYRTIVFRISGTIHLTSKLHIPANTTIAGQTAPGDGICVADHPVVIAGDNVIVRYMRFRMGDKNQNKGMVDGSGGDDTFGGLGVSNIIIDHCSVSWSADEALTIYRGDNLTIQWCFITEPLNYSYHWETGDTQYEQHGYNGIQGAKHASIHHNLYADARNRNPRFAGISTYSPSTVGIEMVDFRNNVIYNWGINTVYGGEGGNYNVVNNYYKWGPNTSSGVKYRICNPSYTSSIAWGKWFVDGNYVDGSTQNTNNNWSGVEMGTSASDTVQAKVTTPFNVGFTVTPQTAVDAFESVLQNAGAILPRRDTLDQRIALDVRNRTGRIIDVQGGYPHGTAYNLTVNAWPTLNSTTAPVDTDQDGMPDSWETSHGLSPNDASDRNVYDGSGYTMLENYLNGVTNNNTDPVLAVGGSLSSFSQLLGSPSATKTYSISGYNLTNNVTVTPPTGYELSLDGATWYGSANPLVVTPSSGTLSNTTIYVRLNAAADGTYSGNIVHASTGASSVNMAVTGVATSVAAGLGVYPTMDGGFEKQTVGAVSTAAPTGAANSVTTVWTTTGSADIKNDGTARSGNNYFTYTSTSKSTKNNFAPSQTNPFYPNNTKFIVQYYYRALAPATGNQVSGCIAVTDNTSATSFTLNHSTAAWTATNGAWVKATTTRFVNVTAYTPTIFLAGFRFNGGTTYEITKPFDIDDFVVYPADNQASPAADVTAPDAPTSPVATGNANNNSIAVSWTAPSTGVDGGGYIVVRSTAATAPVPNENGLYVAGNTMGAGYQVVYIGTNTSFTDADASLSPTTRYYYYVFTADKAYNYCTTPVAVNIMIDEPPASTPTISTTGALSAFSQTAGSPSPAQTISVSGSNLTADITITAPAGFQLSTDNGTTWNSTVTLTQNSGAVAATTVSVRLNASATGVSSGNLVLSSTGATTVNIAVSGNTVSAGSQPPAGTKAIVAKDGTGNYTSIQAAINAVPTGQIAPYKIFIRKGKYVETVSIPSNKPFIQLIGESLAETILSYDNYSGKANPAGGTYGTSTSATLTINAPDVMLMNLSIENATGYGINANAAVPAPGDGPQALACYTTSDRVVFYNCRMNGGQDTYCGGNVKGTRVYFKNCYVDGNTDFLFGTSTIIYDTCIIYPRTRLDNGTGGFITAVNTKDGSGYGYVFRDCKITKNRGTTLYTMGRPWQNDANTTDDAAKSRNKTVFLNTIMGSTIKPEGWSAWDAGTNTSYITYGEYNSVNYSGAPVNVSSRVSWSKQLTAADAVKYYNNDTVFMNANTPMMAKWDPYATWSELRNAFKPELAVSNVIARKVSNNSSITWNMSWPMAGITCDLYRSSDRINFSKISSQVSSEDTACNFSFSESVPPPGQTYYYIVRASKSGYTGTTSDTAAITSKQTITVAGSMDDFLQGLGAPSAIQTFVLSGANLTENITVTPPVGYEVSVNNTTWYNSTTPLVVTQSGGNVANTFISVRLNGTSIGTYNGNIVSVSTGAATVNMAVNGKIQADPLSNGGIVLEQWPLTTNNSDSAAVRSVGVVGTTPALNRLVLSNGTTVPAVPGYSALHGQAFAATADGYWTTGSGGPGSTLSRGHYEQFTVVAASTHSLRVDSIVLSTAFHNAANGAKVAVLFSKTGFRTDSTEIKVASRNGTVLTPGTNGTFTNAFDINNQTAGNADVYTLVLSGAAGVTIKSGDTLSFRIYHCTGATTDGVYAKLKNVIVKGRAEKNPVNGDFRTVRSGEWSDYTTWEKFNGTNWVATSAATDYPAYDNGISTATIQNGHTVSYTQTFSKGFGYIQKTVIANGGQLIVAAGKTLSVAGIDGTTIVVKVDGTLTNLGAIGSNSKVLYQVNGRMVNSGTISLNTADSIAVTATATYQHDMNGGLPARISFAPGSTLLVTGIKTAQTNLFATTATTVGNMTWNCPAQQNYFALRSTLAAVAGNFTVKSTGNTYVALANATATVRIGGNYTQTGGTIYFNEGASNIIDSLVVGGDFIASGGTLTSNMKSSDPMYIKLNGSDKTFTLPASPANTHIQVNGAYSLGGNVALPTAGFGLVVNGTLNSGTYTVGGKGNITVADKATVSFGAAGGIDSNFNITGTKQYSTNANYTFNGSVAQATGITMPVGARTVTINNSANVTLSAPLTAGTVNLLNGKLLLGNNTLKDTTITGTMPTSYIVLNGTGTLKQLVGATSGNVLFPVGNTVTSYSPVTISNSGAADHFSVSVKDNPDYAITDTTRIVRKQWTITPDNASGSANVGVTFGWITPDQGSAFKLTGANILNYRSGNWATINATTGGSGTTAVPYTAAATGVTQFGAFVVSNAPPVPAIATSGVLNPFSQTEGKPTDAQTFKVTVANVAGAVTITPPAGYELSVDTGKTWYSAASVPSLAVGTSTTFNRSVMVRLNASGAGLYEGNITVQSSGATPVNVLVTGTAYSVYTINPNPARNYVNIFHTKLYTQANIRIYNMNGRLVGTYRSKRATNYTSINISAMPNGMYFVEVERLDEKVLLKFIKQ